MIPDQPGQRLGIQHRIQDPFDDHVEATIQQQPSHRVDQRDCMSATIIARTQKLPPNDVLAEDRNRTLRA